VLLVGCGSGQQSATVLTKAEFVKEAEAICQNGIEGEEKAFEEAAAQRRSYTQAQREVKVEEFASQLKSLYRGVSEELSELSLAPKEERIAGAIAAKVEVGVKKLSADPVIVLKTNPLLEAAEAASKFGLEECGRL
jgi:hypothetical protein